MPVEYPYRQVLGLEPRASATARQRLNIQPPHATAEVLHTYPRHAPHSTILSAALPAEPDAHARPQQGLEKFVKKSKCQWRRRRQRSDAWPLPVCLGARLGAATEAREPPAPARRAAAQVAAWVPWA